MLGKVSVTINVPVKALDVLKILQQENNALEFKVNKVDRSVTLSGTLMDFKDYTNDWDSLEDINDYLRKVE